MCVCVCVCVCACVCVCVCVCVFVLFFGFFFNPTTEVVIYRLRGWCLLGVFLLPGFTRLGHECQDVNSLEITVPVGWALNTTN